MVDKDLICPPHFIKGTNDVGLVIIHIQVTTQWWKIYKVCHQIKVLNSKYKNQNNSEIYSTTMQ